MAKKRNPAGPDPLQLVIGAGIAWAGYELLKRDGIDLLGWAKPGTAKADGQHPSWATLDQTTKNLFTATYGQNAQHCWETEVATGRGHCGQG